MSSQDDHTSAIDKLRLDIQQHASNVIMTEQGYTPLFTGSPTAKIVIIGQAPGIRAQTSGIVWDDASGERLIKWLGIKPEQFRDERIISHMPMDFYYPGRGKSGDLPPRKDFADLWHPKLMSLMPNVELILLIGQYSQNYYLKPNKPPTLTETVRGYQAYLPKYFPLVHPSPLNFRWFNQNPWFESEIIPELQLAVAKILK